MNHQRLYSKFLLIPLLLAGVLFFCQSRVYGSQSHLRGTVSVEGNKKLRKLIVFLEPVGKQKSKTSPVKHKVTQKGRRFVPELLVVTQGDTVQYLNDEDKEIDHNIYSLNKITSFDLGLGPRGTILEKKFKKKGKVNYFCSVHKLMEGKVIILPSRHYTVLDKPGSFILPDVPPGNWRVHVFISHRRFKAEPLEISVGANPLNELILKVVKK